MQFTVARAYRIDPSSATGLTPARTNFQGSQPSHLMPDLYYYGDRASVQLWRQGFCTMQCLENPRQCEYNFFPLEIPSHRQRQTLLFGSDRLATDIFFTR